MHELQQENDRLRAELAQLQREQEPLQKRDCLLTTVAQVANLLLRSQDYQSVLPDVVRLLGKAVESNRCMITQEVQLPGDGQAIKLRTEWCQIGIPSTLGTTPDLATRVGVNGCAEFQQRLLLGETVNILVAELPDHFWKDAFLTKGITSLLIVPIMVQQACWGHIGFDNFGHPRLHDEAEIAILRIAADSVAAAIERQAKDQELQTSEVLYRSLFEISSEGIYRWELDEPMPSTLPVMEKVDWIYKNLRITQANAAYLEMKGVSDIQELRDLRLVNFHVPNSERNQSFMLNCVENNGQIRNAESEEVDRNGRNRYFLNSIISFIEHDIVTGGWGTRIDITELREIQQALLKAEQDHAAELAKTNQALKNSIDRLTANPNLDSFLGYVLLAMTQQLNLDVAMLWLHDATTQTLPLEFLVEQGRIEQGSQIQAPASFLRPSTADAPVWQTLLQTQQPFVTNRENGKACYFRDTYNHQTNRLRLQVAINFLLMLGDEPLGMLALASTSHISFSSQDIELAQALAHQATLAIQLKRLAEEAKQAALFEERNRMASEIHDVLAQAFTGISVQLELAKYLIHQNPIEIDQILDRISDLAQTGLTEARRSVWSVYPTDENYADLAQNLTDCIQQLTSGTSLKTDVTLCGEAYPLSSFIGKNLLRIGQEAITNSLKHAQAGRLEIELTYTPDQVTLRVCDDGCGFSPQDQTDGFGLIGISERVERIQGQLRIITQPNQGTEIFVQVPT